jgi:hypothetical protein
MVCLPSPRAMPTIDPTMVRSVSLSVQLATNSPSIFT